MDRIPEPKSIPIIPGGERKEEIREDKLQSEKIFEEAFTGDDLGAAKEWLEHFLEMGGNMGYNALSRAFLAKEKFKIMTPNKTKEYTEEQSEAFSKGSIFAILDSVVYDDDTYGLDFLNGFAWLTRLTSFEENKELSEKVKQFIREYINGLPEKDKERKARIISHLELIIKEK